MSSGSTTGILPGYTQNNRVRLIHGGKEYFDRLKEIIDHARESIHLQVYIYADDATGKQVADALIAAAGRGVAVYLLADGYASQHLSSSFIRRLQQSGIHFRFFEPVFRSRHYYFGRRLHHKLMVADGLYALAGGINISNSYNDMPGHPAWLDFALYLEGDAAKDLCVLCWKTWYGFPSPVDDTPCQANPALLNIQPEEACLVRMRRNDWVRGRNQVSKSYLEIFSQATSQLIVVSSYFLPGRVFRKNLYAAVERGVKVKLVLAGVSDVMLAKQAERYIYRRLLRKNIEIYEYRRSVLHGKLAICDDSWMTLGSYNVNNISAFASIELNLDVNNPVFTASVRQGIEEIIENDCTRVTEKSFYRRNHYLLRLWQETCYGFIRVLLFLFTFYFRREK
ncbi:MAG TPA: phospholipase D-like domain-containing protein [Chitinophagaceae bacterium]|nr:phospholipase D-like domain-containing protein [Chitinophagaceae bacterium]